MLQAIVDDTSLEAAVEAVKLAVDHLELSASEAVPVTSSASAAELSARFSGALPRAGRPLAEVLEAVARDVAADSILLSHPMYLGHQVSAPLPAAVWTEPVISAINNSLAVREMSPAGTALETALIGHFTRLVGWGADAGGTFTSGGTEATTAALMAARAAALPEAWEEGVGAHPPVLVCGEHAHYAVTRAAGVLGLGRRNVVLVASSGYRMDPAALQRTLDGLAGQGRRAMAVVATAGSTSTGSFDDLEAIGHSCAERGVWLHVDGAHGASALISERHRHRLRGLELARSLAWDPHKLLLMPLSAGMVLVRQERDLDAAFAQQAPYLFHNADGARVPDLGVRSLACSRRFDALKLWVAIQRYGLDGLEACHDHLAGLAATLHQRLTLHGGFELPHEPESNILCFRWRGNGGASPETLDDLNFAIRERYNGSGQGWITTTLLDARRMLRVTTMNPRTTPDHLDQLVSGLASTAAALVDEVPAWR
jgi:L-2,4-diaminobutyrate decarboxylase